MATASSASRTWSAPSSTSEYTAAVGMPMARQVRATRTAISPRLAMRILRKRDMLPASVASRCVPSPRPGCRRRPPRLRRAGPDPGLAVAPLADGVRRPAPDPELHGAGPRRGFPGAIRPRWHRDAGAPAAEPRLQPRAVRALRRERGGAPAVPGRAARALRDAPRPHRATLRAAPALRGAGHGPGHVRPLFRLPLRVARGRTSLRAGAVVRGGPRRAARGPPRRIRRLAGALCGPFLRRGPGPRGHHRAGAGPGRPGLRRPRAGPREAPPHDAGGIRRGAGIRLAGPDAVSRRRRADGRSPRPRPHGHARQRAASLEPDGPRALRRGDARPRAPVGRPGAAPGPGAPGGPRSGCAQDAARVALRRLPGL